MEILLLHIKVSRKFRSYCRQAMSLEIRFKIGDRKEEGHTEFCKYMLST